MITQFFKNTPMTMELDKNKTENPPDLRLDREAREERGETKERLEREIRQRLQRLQ